MANAPYTNPPVSPQVKNDADAIYFGWMGLAQDATFQANISLIIKEGIKAALTDPAVIAAQTLAIKNALIDPAVIAANTQAIANGGEDAIYNAVEQLGIDQIIPIRSDWGKAFALVALASVAPRNATFLKSTDAAEYADLKARMNAVEINVLD